MTEYLLGLTEAVLYGIKLFIPLAVSKLQPRFAPLA